MSDGREVAQQRCSLGEATIIAPGQRSVAPDGRPAGTSGILEAGSGQKLFVGFLVNHNGAPRFFHKYSVFILKDFKLFRFRINTHASVDSKGVKRCQENKAMVRPAPFAKRVEGA